MIPVKMKNNRLKVRQKMQEWYRDTDIRKWLLTNIPFLFVFLIADRASFLYRQTSGNAGDKTMYLLEHLHFVLGIIPSFELVDILVGISAAVLLKLLILQKRADAKKFRHGEE